MAAEPEDELLELLDDELEDELLELELELEELLDELDELDDDELDEELDELDELDDDEELVEDVVEPVEEDELEELDEELDELDDDELEDELEDEPSSVPPQPVKPAALVQTAREIAMRAARERDSLNINDLAEIMWGIRVYTYAHDYCGKNRTNPRAGGSYSPEAQHVLVLIFVM